MTLLTLSGLLAVVVMSFAITPIFRVRLNPQFLLGARNQGFLTEYVSGMETVKSLQTEPQLKSRFGDYLAANTLQLLTLLILCLGAWMVMQNDGFTIGMLVAFQMFATR